ncbi:hypothetical protein [Haloarcula onubensis]|uniref:Uncharacterized protein n=1 Tax=Haloarcula onubensis TaxID=2950539 RepID=A0ABU2FPS3_9EURY|nr:hypothetical protein [Halomicroarcula sp. S3CR25-11]MDS0282281.1 hypothetical protein [Halomicroarcula sp. S3CR25-11]
MQEDWDNLLILDGCRFDMFSDSYADFLGGSLESRTSMGSASKEFMENNFYGDSFHDTVYVSANPHSHFVPEGTFHDVITLLDTAWDEETGVVLPEDVVAAARDAHETYPNKRLVVHFMQPHYPFIGELGQQIEHSGVGKRTSDGDLVSSTKQSKTIWAVLHYDLADVSHEDVWEAYNENLDVVMPAVESLCHELGGKTVITADHGNLVGEWIGPLPVRGYGHPPNMYVPELLEVPWHVIEAETRRDVVSDTPVAQTDAEREIVESRLSDLGYR